LEYSKNFDLNNDSCYDAINFRFSPTTFSLGAWLVLPGSNMNKKDLSERDICSKYITPALHQAGWDLQSQIREEVSFTKGRIIVRGRLVTRGKAKRADYILYFKPNIPLALIEAKENNCAIGDGMQQALEYAATLDIPFVFSSNGDAFLFHDRTGHSSKRKPSYRSKPFPRQLTFGGNTVRGKDWRRNKKRFSSRTISKTAAARSRAITSESPSTRPSKPSPGARTASSFSASTK
jgi:type I site-specific restriction endonuclease